MSSLLCSSLCACNNSAVFTSREPISVPNCFDAFEAKEDLFWSRVFWGFSHKTKRIRIICYDPYATDSLFMDDFGHLFDDFGSLDDLQIFGFEENEPSDLPDFDFELGNEEFAWMDGPLNIACL
ncbi:unnamed protein product [Camellia sinensis]